MNFLPSSDSTIISAFNDRSINTAVTANVKEKVISGSIARSNNTSFYSVDPEGYLTHLDTLDSANQEIQDLKKLKTLLKSLLSTNPHQAQSWLAVSRLEEKDGNLKAAKDLLHQALQNCPTSEDIWIELARLEGLNSKETLKKACKNLPNSVKLWMALAEAGENKEEKVEVLRKALENNSESVKLWKEIVAVCDERQAVKFLKNAVICAPHSLDLWLALAKLEDYKAARKTLNDARKQLPCEAGIWIAAARLEETQGNTENVAELIKRGIKTLNNSGVAIDRQQWISEVINSEKAGSLLTAKAILRTTLHIAVNLENCKLVWLADFDTLVQAESFEAARYFTHIVLEHDSAFKKMWKKSFELEKTLGDQQKMKEILKKACKQIKDSAKLWFLLIRVLDIDEIRDYVDTVLALDSLKEKTVLEIFRVLIKNSEFDKAQDLLIRAYNKCKSCKLLVKTVSFYVRMNDLVKAEEVQNQALELFPADPNVYKYVSVIFDYEKSKKLLNSACQTYAIEAKLWIYLAKLEESTGNLVKTRYILEQGRNSTNNPEVFIVSIEFEKKFNFKAAELLCNISLQKFKNNGKIWALSIELSGKKEKKSKIAEAFEHCSNNLDLHLVVAKIFAQERKVEKSRVWFEKCLKVSQDVGDIWVEYYLMEKKLGTEDRVQELEKRVINADIRKGKLWKDAIKKVGPLNTLLILTEASRTYRID